jgi:hypothetical protein
LKKAEREDALIVRLYDAGGRGADARLRLDPALLGRPVAVTEVDLHEAPMSSNTARLDGDCVLVTLRPHAIVTLQIKLAR